MILVTDAMLAQMRSAQELLMTSTVRISSGGAKKWNPATKKDEWIPGPSVYEGPALIQALPADGRVTVAGGQDVTTSTHVVKTPYTLTQARAGHRVDVIASPDPLLPGQWLTLTEVDGNDFVTCRRLLATLILGEPTEFLPPAGTDAEASTVDLAALFLNGLR